MKTKKSNLQLIVSLVMLISLVVAILPLGKSAFAQEVIIPVKQAVGDIPTLVSPLGTITEQVPTFTWSKVFGTSNYQYQVYRGSTKVLDKTVGYSVCSTDICSVKSTLKLVFGVYTWRVRAYVQGVWKTWSEYGSFTVSGPSFQAGFNYTMNGWQWKAGATWNTSPTAIYSNGKAGYWSSVYRPVSQYIDFDYSARMKRTGGIYDVDKYPAQYLSVRMGSSVNPGNDAWYPGYIFGYHDGGAYSIWEYDSTGAVSVIQPWTASAAIVRNGWNVLRVVAQGDTYQFYINGTLVCAFSESIRAKGFVGISMYKGIDSTFTKLQVDWAKLTIVESVLSASSKEITPHTGKPVSTGEDPQGGSQ